MYDYALYGSSLNTLGTLGLIALVLAIVANGAGLHFYRSRQAPGSDGEIW